MALAEVGFAAVGCLEHCLHLTSGWLRFVCHVSVFCFLFRYVCCYLIHCTTLYLFFMVRLYTFL